MYWSTFTNCLMSRWTFVASWRQMVHPVVCPKSVACKTVGMTSINNIKIKLHKRRVFFPSFQMFLYPSFIFCLCLEPLFLTVWCLHIPQKSLQVISPLDSIAPRSRRILQQMGCRTNNASGTTSAARRGQEVMLQSFAKNYLEIESTWFWQNSCIIKWVPKKFWNAFHIFALTLITLSQATEPFLRVFFTIELISTLWCSILPGWCSMTFLPGLLFQLDLIFEPCAPHKAKQERSCHRCLLCLFSSCLLWEF